MMNCKEPSLCVWTLVSQGLNPVREIGVYVCVWGCVSVCDMFKCICMSWACVYICMDIYMAVHGHVPEHTSASVCIGTQMVVWEVYACVCSILGCEYAWIIGSG